MSAIKLVRIPFICLSMLACNHFCICHSTQAAEQAISKSPEEALNRMIAAQKAGDLDAYAASLADPVGPVFKQFADAAKKVGEARRLLLEALDRKFGGANNREIFADVTDDAQQRAILQRLVDMRLIESAPNGDQFILKVETTVRTPNGPRQIVQGFHAIQQNGNWKVEDAMIVSHLDAQKHLSEMDWEIFTAFTTIAQKVNAGGYASRDEAEREARAGVNHAIGKDAAPRPGDADFARGLAAYKSDAAAALTHFLAAANAGHAKAQCQVAIQYLNGIGVAEDEAKAIAWYRKAAAQGNKVAENDLGSLWVESKNPAEQQEGLRLLLLSAEQDYGPALTNLGRCNLFGFGMPKNRVEALAWYEKAAALGDTQAAYFRKWLKDFTNEAFRDAHQAEVFKQLQIIRANAFNVMLGGRGLDGRWVPADPQRAAQMRAEADRLARENGLN